MLLVVPAVSVFVTGCVVWVSTRVSSYQSANSIAGFAVLPLILLVVGQATGVMLLGPGLFAVLGLVLAALDVLMVRWMIATFDREKVVASFV